MSDIELLEHMEMANLLFLRGIYTTSGYLAILDHIVAIWRSECVDITSDRRLI